MPAIDPQDYFYTLPQARIAQYPLAERDQARLLQYRDGQLSDHRFYELDQLLPADTLLVVNETQVIPARLRFARASGRPLEVFLLGPMAPSRDFAEVMAADGPCVWACMLGHARRWKLGESLYLAGSDPAQGTAWALEAKLLARSAGMAEVELSWQPSVSLAQLLDWAGQTPLPPYMQRDAEPEDRARYQTVYARWAGSVAAPTAGLHFTPALLERLAQRGIPRTALCLHVGAGTFKPLQADQPLTQHVMHTEPLAVRYDTLAHLAAHRGALVAVGTTSLRSLESLYWMGAQLWREPMADVRSLPQWLPYQASGEWPTWAEALQALQGYMHRQGLETWVAETQLMLVPGYRFRAAAGLITNFHQPGSTLMLLVAAWLGADWRRVYQHALAGDYRFLSYGDASLLWRRDT